MYSTLVTDVKSIHHKNHSVTNPDSLSTLIARLVGLKWGQTGVDRTQLDTMLSPWSLLSGILQSWATQTTPT